jgi:hypothetical protein
MAFSLAGSAALAAVGRAQEAPVVRPSPLTYDVKIQPWPSKPKSSQTTPSPFTPPDAGFVPPPPPPIDQSKTPNAASMKTLYYKKDTNAPVKPSAAAELTRPIAAEGQQPTPPSRGDTEAIGTTVKDPLVPSPDKLFRLDAEPQFQLYVNNERKVENVRRAKLPIDTKEDRKPLDMLDFPAHKPVPGGEGPFMARAFAQREEVIEPNYVLYRRLLFEDVNTERYGWTLGPLQPFVSTYEFFGQVQYLPYRYFSFPCRKHDTGAGQCLPGDPVPSMIYPPALSVTGALAQAGVTVALYAIIP